MSNSSSLLDLETYWEFAEDVAEDVADLMAGNNWTTNTTSYWDNATNTTIRNDRLVNATKPTDSSVLQQTFSAYGTVLFVTLLVFCWARLQFPLAYNVRKKNVQEEKPIFLHPRTRDDVSSDIKTHLANDSYGFFSWSWTLFTLSEKEIMDECGMDALCFLRICSMGYRFALCGIGTAIWLMPVYATAKDSSTAQEIVEDQVVEITTGNVHTADPRLIATALATYIIFGHAMYVIQQEFDWFIQMRHRFLSKPKARNYAIYVRNIPPGWRSNHGLKEFFEKSIRGVQVLQSHMCVKAGGLRKKVAARERILEKLEHSVAEADEYGVRPTHVPEQGLVAHVLDRVPLGGIVSNALDHAPMGELLTGNKNNAVDSIRYYKEVLQVMNRDITEHIQKLQEYATMRHEDEKCCVEENDMSSDDDSDTNAGHSLQDLLVGHVDHLARNFVEDQKRVTKEAAGMVLGTANVAKKLIPVLAGDDGEVLSAGFVVFSSLSTTHAALQMIHHEKPYTMEAVEAPDPDDINWFNVGRGHRDLKLGALASLGISSVVCLFWTVPVTFVASLANVAALRRDIEAIDTLLRAAPWMEPVLEVLAPQLLVGLNSLLPVILLWATNFQGSVSGSVNQASLFTKLAAFAIIQTFFVSSLSGGVLRELQRIIRRPEAFIDLLAVSLPAQSTFFIQMSFISTTTTFFSESLSPIRVVTGFLRSFLGPQHTARERKKPYMFLRPLSQPQEFQYSFAMSNLVLLFMVYLVYSVIAPLICFVMAFCFVLLQILFRHQFVYIYPPRPDSGGKLWLNFISVVLNCMMIAQLTIIGLLTLKKSWASSFMIPLLVATLFFYIYLHDKHFVVAEFLPTRICLSRDLRNQAIDFSFTEDCYLQPEMKEPIAVPDLSRSRLQQLGFEVPSDTPVKEVEAQENHESDEKIPSESISTKNTTTEPQQEGASYRTLILPTNGGTCRVRKLELPSDVYVTKDSESQSLMEEEEEEIKISAEMQA